MSLKICCISDTHSFHRKVVIPECDLLICAGDITFRGELEIIADFAQWMKEQPAKHRVCIFGNHEVGMRFGPKRPTALKMLADAGIIYLEDSGVEIEGLSVYGSPASPFFYDWEWNYQRGKDIAQVWAKIPDDTDILITHGPPNGSLDAVQETWRGPQGCEELRKRVDQLPNLKASIHGHLHFNGNQRRVIGNTIFVNAAIC